VPESIAFDRAAEYYDRTRVTDPETLRETVDVLQGEFGGRGRVLEIGVGTGALALPLAERGVPMLGLDLSMPMMRRLVEKAGGRQPFPLVQGDATGLPFREDSLGAAFCRWVLHLIPTWRDAVAELCRVVRPGGVIVTEPGGFAGGWREMWLRFVDLLGDRIRPVGLDWVGDFEDLDAAFAGGGAVRRDLPPIVTRNDSTLARYFTELDQRLYSWTWRVPPDELEPAVAEVRAWAERTHPDFDTPFEPESPILWRAYDLRGAEVHSST
jgi:SAM-dependent methyltransferase